MGTDNKKKGVDSSFSLKNIIVTIIIAIIIVTFVFIGDSFLGIGKFFSDIGKEKIKNADGSYSIPAEAQVGENGNNPNAYVGRVNNDLIQLGANDEFNYNLQRVFNTPNLDPETKYQYTRYFFNQAINKIIGMNVAKKMNISISKKYMLNETAKRYYADVDGVINYALMEEESSKLAEKTKDVKLDILYNNYVTDFFKSLPISQKEAKNLYKMEETKVQLKYINLSANDVSLEDLTKYYNENKHNYRQVKLTKMIFNKSSDAKENLEALVAKPETFVEVGTQLKTDNKVLNVTYEDFKFVSELEMTLSNVLLKDATPKTVLNQVFDTEVGPAIVYVEDVKTPALDESIKYKVQSEYLANNEEEANANLDKKAQEVYKIAVANGIDAAGKQFSLSVETMPNPASILEPAFPYLTDNTSDNAFILSAFKAKEKDVLIAYKYENEYSRGYLIAVVDKKIEPDMAKFESDNNDVIKKYSDYKSSNLENDFYQKEKRNYKVIDNFQYVFNRQFFYRNNDGQ